jgi:hypothetical protein
MTNPAPSDELTLNEASVGALDRQKSDAKVTASVAPPSDHRSLAYQSQLQYEASSDELRVPKTNYLDLTISRRRFLPSAVGALAFAVDTAQPVSVRPKIAVILTEYRPSSHADVWVTALLEGYDNGQPRTPSVQIVSMYIDQFPSNDMSRAMAAKHGFEIAKTIPEALMRGTNQLAVDGVLLMAEHGKYPVNVKGQILYPRYEFYHQIMDVYRQSGKAVPLFCDKHLSYDWEKAKWMYDQSRALHFPLMAGSSIPLTWREPPLELDLGTPVEKAVVAAFGPKESYGFHSLEALECMVERRLGGEKGIAAVQCLESQEVWKWTGRNDWSKHLLTAALDRVENPKPKLLQVNKSEPVLFLVDYVDGLQAAVYLLNGYITDWVFAAQIQGRSEIASTKFWTRMKKPWSHATGLTYQIEQLYLTRRAPYPVERTLLMTGALAALMDSSYHGNRRRATPHLRVSYSARKKSLFNRGRIPPPELLGPRDSASPREETPVS